MQLASPCFLCNHLQVSEKLPEWLLFDFLTFTYMADKDKDNPHLQTADKDKDNPHLHLPAPSAAPRQSKSLYPWLTAEL